MIFGDGAFGRKLGYEGGGTRSDGMVALVQRNTRKLGIFLSVHMHQEKAM